MTSDTDTTTQDDEPASDGLVTVTSDTSVEETISRIENDIENSPLTLVTTIDHAANAASVDKDLPSTTLLIFGNPDVGTPLMNSSRSVAIDLPQKMLVWEDAGQTKVTYNDPQYLAQRHGIEGENGRLEQISAVLNNLATG
jgi:uncharacterized protein (DUF302 family)